MKSSVAELNSVKKLKSMSPSLYTDLQAVEKFCEEVWKSNMLPWFTKHDPDHSREIIIILDQLLKPLVDNPAFLSEHELFVLLSSAYLHDIGMQFLKHEGISIEQLTEQEYNYVRKKHAELSSEIIFKRTAKSIDRDDFNLPDIDDEYIAPIALACKAHSTEYFAEVMTQLQEESYTPKGRTFRGELLAALLLIADELDLQCKRVNFKETAKFKLSVHSQVHWYKHHYVDYVGISGNVVEVTLRFPSEAEEYRPLFKDLIETKLIAQIRMVNPYLQKDTKGLLSLNDQVRFTQLSDGHNVKRELPPEVLTELRRVMGITSLPFSSASESEIYGTPIPKLTNLFTGMERKKAEFRELLITSNLISVEGLGGAGKTEFILKCIEEFLPAQKVNWFECFPESKADSLIGLSGYPDTLKGENKTDLAKYSGFIDLIERDEKTLILDNFHTLTGNSLEDLIKFAEKRLKKARIILVSREHPNFDVKFVPIEIHGLGDEALLYAKKFKDKYYKTLQLSEGDLKDICTALNGHPLAIELALQLLNYGESSDDIIRKIVCAKDKSRELSNRLLDEIVNHPKSTEQEKEFLFRFSVFRTEIDKDGLSSLFDGEDMSSILYKLIDKKMVSVERGLYRSHPLIREFCYQRLSEKKSVHERVASYFETKRTDRFDPIREEEIFYHLFSSNNKKRTSDFISDTGEKFFLSGYLDILYEMIQKVLAWELDRPEYQIFLGDIATQKGDFNEAFHYFENGFSFKNASGKITTEAYIKFGETLYRKADVKEAQKYFEDANQRCEKYDYKREHARSLNDLGLVFQALGNLQQAKQWLLESLEIREKIGDTSGIAISLNNIGLLLQAQGDLSGAMQKFKESLEIRTKIGDRSGIADSLDCIGINLYHGDNLSGAMQKHKEALEIRKEIGDKSGIAHSFNNIGAVLCRRGDLSGAMQRHKEALKIRKEIGDKYGIALSFNNIGAVLQNQGDLSGAMQKYNDSLEIRKEIGKWSDIAESLNNIGMVWHSKKNYNIALEYMLKSYAILTKIGANSDTITNNIHSIKDKLGLKLFKKICEPVYESLAEDLQAHFKFDELTENKTIVCKTDKVGRNEPCPCGSEKKYKKCCGK